MLRQFALALLFKKSKQWLMPLFVVVFSVFLLFQQFAAFLSVKSEVVGFCRELEDVDLWIKGDHLSGSDLAKVKILPEVLLASFLFKGNAEANSLHGAKKMCTLLGVDESTHLGLPSKVLYGQVRLKGSEESVILNESAARSLFKLGNQKLKSGSSLYLDGHQIKVSGVTSLNKGLFVYTNLGFAKEISNDGETMMVIKAAGQTNLSSLKQRIERVSGLKAYTSLEFSEELFHSYMKENKVVSLFSVIVICALILALGIFAAIFYHFFKSQMNNYSILKAVGATSSFLSLLLTLQAALISLIGWSISFVLYLILSKVFMHSDFFFPLSFGIVFLTLSSLLAVSVSAGLFISFKVKEVT